MLVFAGKSFGAMVFVAAARFLGDFAVDREIVRKTGSGFRAILLQWRCLVRSVLPSSVRKKGQVAAPGEGGD